MAQDKLYRWVKASEKTPDDYKPPELLSLRLLSSSGDVWIPTSGTFSKKDESFYFEDGFNPRSKDEFDSVQYLEEIPVQADQDEMFKDVCNMVYGNDRPGHPTEKLKSKYLLVKK